MLFNLKSKLDKTKFIQDLKNILEESLAHEQGALKLYKKFLENVADRSIYLEEYARGLIGQEEQHSLELKAMLKDFG